jgi:hypothetical protein
MASGEAKREIAVFVWEEIRKLVDRLAEVCGETRYRMGPDCPPKEPRADEVNSLSLYEQFQTVRVVLRDAVRDAEAVRNELGADVNAEAQASGKKKKTR